MDRGRRREGADLPGIGGAFTVEVPRNPAASALDVRWNHPARWRAGGSTPAPPFRIVRDGPREWLRFDLGAVAGPAQFWRARIRRPVPPPIVDGIALDSFDTAVDGTGASTVDPALLRGFASPPVLTQSGTVLLAGGAGGAASFAGPDGNTWLGSGSSQTPGHSLGWNPGSTGNRFVLQLSTLHQQDIIIRCDIRSAQQAGGAAPAQFSAFTYDLGSGPQPVPGTVLDVTADNQFHEWTANLTALDAIENQPAVTLVWEFEDLGGPPNPQESFRLDNLVILSTAIAE
ncbi:MAG: hypothetical protein R3F11_19365 [Verrucomicrobiales bacterium]